MAKIGTTSTGNNADWSHTVSSGTDLALAVLIGTHQGNITSVTWNSTSLTQVASGSSSSNEDGDVWVLMNPTPATGTVDVTMSGGSWFGGIAVNLSYVRQVPVASLTSSSTGGNSSTASTSITPSGIGSLILSAVGSEASTSTVSGVLLSNLQGQSYENASGQYVKNAKGSTTVTFSLGSGQRWGIAAVVFEASPTVNKSFYLKGGFQ